MNWDNFSIFNALSSNLNPEKARKAKVLYLKNIITVYKFFSRIIPLFLLGFFAIFIIIFSNSIRVFPAFALLQLLFLFIQSSILTIFFGFYKQIINNILEAWKEDLGDDYLIFKRKLESIKLLSH